MPLFGNDKYIIEQWRVHKLKINNFHDWMIWKCSGVDTAAITLTNAGSNCFNIIHTKNAEKISEFYILSTVCKPNSLTYHILD